MQVIKPNPITDATFVSSTVPETDYPAWDSGTTYAIGDTIIKGHRIWESLQASNTNKDPETDAVLNDPPYWLDVGPTNRWAMFDNAINTSTTATGSMTVVVQPGLIDSLALVDVIGSTAQVRMLDGSTVVYDQTQTLDGTIIEDWYEYFFEPFDYVTQALFTDLPQYYSATVEITITDPVGGTVSISSLVAGPTYTIGGTEYGASVGITDYSRKETNTFGVTQLIRRAYSKRSSQRLWMGNTQIRRVERLLADLRATPCLWIGVEEDVVTYEPLVVFGFYKDFQIEIAEFARSFCSLEIEGMT